jgi:hypothetical protein
MSVVEKGSDICPSWNEGRTFVSVVQWTSTSRPKVFGLKLGMSGDFCHTHRFLTIIDEWYVCERSYDDFLASLGVCYS